MMLDISVIDDKNNYFRLFLKLKFFLKVTMTSKSPGVRGQNNSIQLVFCRAT